MKKKSLLLVAIVGVLLLVTACSNDKLETMTCTRTINQNGIKMTLTYNVDYKGEYVTEVKSVETVESENNTILKNYKDQLEKIYNTYKDIEYYDNKTEIVGNKLTSTTIINYEKIDTDKMIEIDSANKQLIKDGKIKVKDIKSVYESVGASCN